MTIKRREKESNFALLRRFNREILLDGKIMRAKDKKEYKKDITRREVRSAALRREQVRQIAQEY